MKILKKLNTFAGRLVNIGVSIYQYTISPDKGIFSYFLKGRICAHEPHCSAYGKECLKRYGLFPWITYTTERVLACKPAMEKTYDPSHYRIVFFSGSPIGVPFLEYLATDPRYEIVGLVTMQDKPLGRGQQIQENIIKKTAKRLGIKEILTPSTLKKTDESIDSVDIAAKLQTLQADWFFVIAYGKIIPTHILELPIFWSINLHGSLLPALRGASPLQSIFLSSDQLHIHTGFSVIEINEKMDEWDVLWTYAFDLPFHRTAKDLFTKVEKIWPKFLADTIRDYSKWDINPLPQNHEKATYCKKITKEDGEINLFETPLSELYAKYRAYAIRPWIRTTWNGKILLIEEIVCDEALFSEHQNKPVIIYTNPGDTHTKINKKDISLNPAIQKILLKPEGKKTMDRKDFLNGYVK